MHLRSSDGSYRQNNWGFVLPVFRDPDGDVVFGFPTDSDSICVPAYRCADRVPVDFQFFLCIRGTGRSKSDKSAFGLREMLFLLQQKQKDCTQSAQPQPIKGNEVFSLNHFFLKKVKKYSHYQYNKK